MYRLEQGDQLRRLGLLATLATVLALAVPAAPALMLARPAYQDDPGGGGGGPAVFYVCTPERCGWWVCWPGQACQPL